MTCEVIIHTEAEMDITTAYQWYEDKVNGLGHRFLNQVDAAFQFIARYPYLAPEIYRGTRKHLLKRFPYHVIYLIENDRIIVLAVIHAKRNPNYVHNRLI